MVDYLKALNMKQAPPLTPYYAQLESNRHPGWPTHMLWAQLMSEIIISLLRNISFTLNQLSPLETITLSSPSPSSLQFHVPDKLTTFGICSQVLKFLLFCYLLINFRVILFMKISKIILKGIHQHTLLMK